MKCGRCVQTREMRSRLDNPRRRASLLDRLADVTLVALLLSLMWEGQRVWHYDISRTREIMLFYCMVGLAIAKRPWRFTARGLWYPALSLLVLCAVGFFTWTLQLTSLIAMNYWNEYLLIAAALALGVAFGRARWHAWRRILIVIALLAASFQVIVLLLGATTLGFSPSAPAFYGARPITAQIALLVLLGFVLLLTDGDTPQWARVVGATLLGVSVVLAQHRSVWIALLVVIPLGLVSVAAGKVPRSSVIALAVTSGYFVLALIIPLVGWTLLPGGLEVGDRTGTSGGGLPPAATASDTLDWRVDMWVSRIAAPRSLVQWLFGGVLGQTPAFGPSSQVMNRNNSAHNLALDVQLMVGLVGLALLATVFVIAVLGEDRLGELQIFLWGALAFGVFYVWPTWSFLVLGVAAARSSATRGETDRPGKAPPRATSTTADAKGGNNP